jgi:hypothetical protein
MAVFDIISLVINIVGFWLFVVLLLPQMLALRKTEDDLSLRDDDIVVAVMGPTGAGKSTWISMMTDANVRTSSSLSSCKCSSILIYNSLLITNT